MNHVLIDHGDGTSMLYLHLAQDSARVRVGEVVTAGAPLGTAGASGWTRDVRLHVQLQDTPPPDARSDKGWFLARSRPLAFADAPVRALHADGALIDGDIVVSDHAVSDIAPYVPLERPSSLPARLPWSADTAHSLVAAYDPDAPEGYGLHIDPTDPFDVHPLFGGEVVFAGCASGRSMPLGGTVIVRRVLEGRTYHAVHAHLASITQGLGSSSSEVGPDDVIGTVGDAGVTDGTATKPVCGPVPDEAPLYVGILADATITPQGGISGGTPVDPEPLVGRGAYEGLAWWSGPLTARAIDRVPEGETPRLRWAGSAVEDGVRIGFGEPLALAARVRDGAGLREVRFRVYYPDWPRSRQAARRPGFDPRTDWRILAICRPPGVGGEPRRTRGCRWDGDGTDALVRFDWDPTAAETSATAPWLPRARTALTTNNEHCVPVSLAIEAVDSAGRVLRTNGGPTRARCAAGPRADTDARATSTRVAYLQPLRPPRAPARVRVRCLQPGQALAQCHDVELTWLDRSDDEAGFRIYARAFYFDCDRPRSLLDTSLIEPSLSLVDDLPANRSAWQVDIPQIPQFGQSMRTFWPKRGVSPNGLTFEVASYNDAGESTRVTADSAVAGSSTSCL